MSCGWRWPRRSTGRKPPCSTWASSPPHRASWAAPRRAIRSAHRVQDWQVVAPTLATTLRTYLDQIALTLRPATVKHAEATLREFGRFLAQTAPEVTCLAMVRRSHIEAFKQHLGTRPARGRGARAPWGSRATPSPITSASSR